MGFFFKAVVTGFGLTLGAAIFKKHVAPRIGLEEDTRAKKSDDETLVPAASDPGLPS